MLDRCFPIPAMDVPFERILDFKNERHGEFLQLRDKIRTFEADIAVCENCSEVKSVMARFRESWEKELDSSEKMFRDSRIGITLGSLKSFINDAAGISGVLQLMYSDNCAWNPRKVVGVSLGISGAVAIGTAYFNARKRDTIQNNGFAYLVSAKREGLLRGSNMNRL